jgi:hypothetical protein
MPDIAAARPTSGVTIETAWGQQVHDWVEGLQSGEVTITLGGANPFTGTAVVTFPKAYQVPPALVVGARAASNMKLSSMALNVTTTGFTAVMFRDGGSAGAVAYATWIAVGKPA